MCADVCKGVLRHIMRMPQAEAIKVARPGAPTHPDQKCTDLASVLDLLDEGAAGVCPSPLIANVFG